MEPGVKRDRRLAEPVSKVADDLAQEKHVPVGDESVLVVHDLSNLFILLKFVAIVFGVVHEKNQFAVSDVFEKLVDIGEFGLQQGDRQVVSSDQAFHRFGLKLTDSHSEQVGADGLNRNRQSEPLRVPDREDLGGQSPPFGIGQSEEEQVCFSGACPV